MKRVLVSGASGVVGFGILRSLRISGFPFYLVGTSIHEESVAPMFCDRFLLAPRTDSAEYMDWLATTVREQAVDIVIPGIEADMFAWPAMQRDIEAAGARCALNRADLIALCGDKWDFFLKLKSLDLACAIESTLTNCFDAIVSVCGLPFIIKPKRGYGSRGVFLISTETEFLPHEAEIGIKLIAQRYVDGASGEFTTSVFGDGAGGFSAHITFQRELSKLGFTEKARVQSSDAFLGTIHELCQVFRPVGPTNFQFRKDAEQIKLLEINPRISSSTSLRAAFGYNESLMTVDYFLHATLPVQPSIRKGFGLRYPEDYISYEDSDHL